MNQIDGKDAKLTGSISEGPDNPNNPDSPENTDSPDNSSRAVLTSTDLQNQILGYFPKNGAQTTIDFGTKATQLDQLKKKGYLVPEGLVLNSRWCQDKLSPYFVSEKSLPKHIGRKIFAMLHSVTPLIQPNDATQNPVLIVRASTSQTVPYFMQPVGFIGVNTQTDLSEGTLQDQAAKCAIAYQFSTALCCLLADFEADDFHHAVRMELKAKSIQGKGSSHERVEAAQKVFRKLTGRAFPQTLYAQLLLAIEAVYKSWISRRGSLLRQAHGIPDEPGPALIIQQMILPDFKSQSPFWMGEYYSRNTETGEKGLIGKLENITYFSSGEPKSGFQTNIRQPALLKDMSAKLGQKLEALAAGLEKEYGSIQEFSFIARKDEIHLLQSIRAEATAKANLALIARLVEEGEADLQTALLSLRPEELTPILHPVLDPKENGDWLAKGIPASPGAATGTLVFKATDAIDLHRLGKSVVLLCARTGPEDIPGMKAAQAIMTTQGGTGSHAACIARTVGTPCVTNIRAFNLIKDEERVEVSRHDGTRVSIAKGEDVTVDGVSGQIYLGKVNIVPAYLPEEFHQVMNWCNKIERMQVRTNVDHPDEMALGIGFEAEGVGLVRTEHMFQSAETFKRLQSALFSGNADSRAEDLKAIRWAQHAILASLLQTAENQPVTIRLLDAPLHEFLPEDHQRDREEKKDKPFFTTDNVLEQDRRLLDLSTILEHNPMMGHRGCRLAISHPDILECQIQAVLDAANSTQKKMQIEPVLEIMIPFVSHAEEVRYLRGKIDKIIAKRQAEEGRQYQYKIGAMIEVPRAALHAAEIAKHCDFLSFGTNDLTQLTWGFSRDDAAPTLQTYTLRQIITEDPFNSLDQTGVGELIRTAIQRARQTNPSIICGVCGEHAGDPASIDFFERAGVDYISCSPFRLPIARLAAAQAAIRHRQN